MAEPRLNDVMKYVLSSDIGNIPKRGNKELKKVVINGKEYRYNKEQPFSTKLTKKLQSIAKTQGFKRYEILHRAGQQAKMRQAIQTYAIRRKAKITNERQALKRYANTYSISNINLSGYRGLSYLKYQKERLTEYLKKEKQMKVLIEVDVAFNHPEAEEVRHTIRSRRYNILNEEDLNKAINNMAGDIEEQIENSQLKRSGLTIKKIMKITIHYDKYDPTRAGSYIELPKWVSLKKACINIKNDDDYCFKYCVQCYFYNIFKNHNPERMYHYNKLKNNDSFLKWDNVNFPASNDDIDYFEEINEGSISINVYVIDEDKQKIRADRITKKLRPTCHVNLLRLEKDNNSHYVLIKDFSRLMSMQTNKNKIKLFHCQFCQKGFQKENLLTQHTVKGCMANNIQNVEMPEKDKTFFKNHYKKLKCPYVIYGDFECLTTQTNEGIKGTYQEHKPSGFMLNVVNSITNECKPYLYRGEDCMNKFCETMNEIREEIMYVMKHPLPMNDLTEQEQKEHDEAKRCFICNGCFDNKKDGKKKVRDHCHFTGQYRGPAHLKCNLDFCFKDFKIPVFFHNLKNYDAHLIISNLDKLDTEKDEINVIAQNSEKFITFCLKELEFKDTFSFLSSSLDKLVKLTKYEENDKRNNWTENFKFSKTSKYITSDEDLDLLTDKGVYPYDYFTDFTKFNETSLPSIEDFYSQLTEQNIEQKEYDRAKHIWKHFNIKDLGEYHDLYLQTDVFLLTDVFENFRTKCLEDYGLDPAHYYTLPNFSWDAMLLKTGISLQLVQDEEVYKMFEEGLRGGMCQTSLRKADANNKYMGEDYDKSKESSYINYLDANNLYGLAMCQKLPYKDIKFEDKPLTEEEIINYTDGSLGYIVDVDLEYPDEVHEKHKDYPLAPQIMNVTADMLSETQKEIYKSYNHNKEPTDEKTNKLILNVYDKQRYVCHVKILQYYLKQGLKIKRVWRTISFKQKAWLKPWIDFNTNKRKQATSDFEKDMYKLMNNAVYGKTMENVREHIDFELVNTPQRYQKCVNSPTFKHRHIINENLVGVEKLKHTVLLNKPIYAGMCILDLSKLHMYSFYYDVLKKKYEDNIRLIYTDTDSFVIHTKTEDIYDDFNEISNHMDFSGYDKSHKCYDPKNKKVLGKFKDECDGKIITSFIGLKPKSYAFKIHNEQKEEKKSKGIVKHKVKKEFNYKRYEDTLNNECMDNSVTFNSIRSKNHQIYSIKQTKQALSSYDNKRYYINNIESLPYGFYSIK